MGLYALAVFDPNRFPFGIPVVGDVTYYMLSNHPVCLVIINHSVTTASDESDMNTILAGSLPGGPPRGARAASD